MLSVRGHGRIREGYPTPVIVSVLLHAGKVDMKETF